MTIPPAALPPAEKKQWLAKRHKEVAQLQAKLASEITSHNSRLAELTREKDRVSKRMAGSLAAESRKEWLNTIAAYTETPLVRKDGATVELTTISARDQASGVRDYRRKIAEKAADVKVSRKILEIKGRYDKDLARLEAEEINLRRQIELNRRKALSPLFSDPEETRRIFAELWQEITDAVNRVAEEKGTLILVDRTYGARPIVKHRGSPAGAALGEQADTQEQTDIGEVLEQLQKAGQFGTYSENAYRAFIDQEIVKAPEQKVFRRDDQEWPFSEEFNIAAGHFIEYFYSLKRLPEYVPSGLNGIVVLKGETDLTAAALGELLDIHNIKKEKKEIIFHFLERKDFFSHYFK